MANSNADLDELAQKAANEIRSCRETGERVSVAAIARQYGVHKIESIDD
jgi:tRNA(Ser,Leu) C12 N-acetylase TAN1